MKTISITVLSLLGTVSSALASGGNEAGGLGLLTILFLAFAAFVVLFQLVPGVRLLGGMLKDIFTASEKKTLKIGSKL